ncbi:MAG TPA: phage tail tip lysozyme [Polyangiaceae bacterium]
MNQLAARLLTPCLLASLSVVTAGCSGGGGEDVGSSTEAVSESANNKTAFDYFVAKGLSKVQAAGIVGNLDQESSMNPSVSQYGGGPGRGIAQWSAGGRWDSDRNDNVVAYAHEKGASAYSLALQLEFVWYELETFGNYGLSDLRRATTVTEATVAFEEDFEGCGQCDQSQRIAYADAALSAYGHGSSSGGGGGGGAAPKGCYSDTLAREMPANACVQSKYDSDWYQCDDGSWVDRWTDPTACDGVYPL